MIDNISGQFAFKRYKGKIRKMNFNMVKLAHDCFKGSASLHGNRGFKIPCICCGEPSEFQLTIIGDGVRNFCQSCSVVLRELTERVGRR